MANSKHAATPTDSTRQRYDRPGHLDPARAENLFQLTSAIREEADESAFARENDPNAPDTPRQPTPRPSPEPDGPSKPDEPDDPIEPGEPDVYDEEQVRDAPPRSRKPSADRHG